MTIWLKPLYSKSAVNHAGDVLIRENKTVNEILEEGEALDILDNYCFLTIFYVVIISY